MISSLTRQYYQLQLGEWSSGLAEAPCDKAVSVDEHIASLVPSFLKFDREGRVIRLDSFSKCIAPGSRLGWVTCNAVFAEVRVRRRCRG